MARTIWKYNLQITDDQAIKMPVGAKCLTVQMQHGQPALWAIVDPKAALELVAIRCHGTGHPMSDDSDKNDYVGTIQTMGGQLVFHFFKVSP